MTDFYTTGQKYKWCTLEIPMSLEAYWRERGITNQTFVVEHVDSRGNAYAIVDGKSQCIATKHRLSVKQVIPFGLCAGVKYKIQNYNARQLSYSKIHRYWKHYNINDHTFVAQFVDEDGNVFCKTSDRKMHMVLALDDVEILDIIKVTE